MISLNNDAKRTFFCECTRVNFMDGQTVSLEFVWPGAAPRGGQFFLIKPRRTGVFLARPISAAGWKKKTDNTEAEIEEKTGILRFLVVRRNTGSREITDLRPGEEAELTGPLGNFWPVAVNSGGDQERGTGKPIALVGGGIGIAPLLLFARELDSRNNFFIRNIPLSLQNPVQYDFYAGFRSNSYGLENMKPRSLIVSSEDGSTGVKGRIPDFFTPSGYSQVYVCGPEPMLRVVGDACIASGVPCFISVERHMACGVGACLGCTVKTTKGNRLCCADGPIFKAEEVCFDSK